MYWWHTINTYPYGYVRGNSSIIAVDGTYCHGQSWERTSSTEPCCLQVCQYSGGSFGFVWVYGHEDEEAARHPTSTPRLVPLGFYNVWTHSKFLSDALCKYLSGLYFRMLWFKGICIWLRSFVNLKLCILSYHPKQIPSICLISRLCWNETL